MKGANQDHFNKKNANNGISLITELDVWITFKISILNTFYPYFTIVRIQMFHSESVCFKGKKLFIFAEKRQMKSTSLCFQTHNDVKCYFKFIWIAQKVEWIVVLHLENHSDLWFFQEHYYRWKFEWLSSYVISLCLSSSVLVAVNVAFK